jgi:hypothetical protein
MHAQYNHTTLAMQQYNNACACQLPDLLEHEVGGMNGNGGSGAVLLRFLDAGKVDTHASAVHGLDLNRQQSERRRWVGRSARQE